MPTSILQEYYNRYREHGGDYAVYVVANDISHALAEELRRNYESTHPAVPQERKDTFQTQLHQELKEAKTRDDFEWLSGTGRYAQ